ncbi:MAG: hypothetical protein Kow00117_19750 [Phototrophicales bacterium]
MTAFNHERLTNVQIGLDINHLRRGYYSDTYFINIMHILQGLQAEGYEFRGKSPRGVAAVGYSVGDVIVEAQIFNRRSPYAVIAGVDVALAIIRHGAGYFEGERFVAGWCDLDVVAVEDGDMTYYNGNPNEVQTVIEIRGKYRDFTLLETPILGVLTRASRIATNVYDVLQAANGKNVLFFPARFDLPSVQSLDGYAYWVALQRYNHETGHQVPPLVSTDAQAAWWGGRGGGTVPHAIIACFLADTAEAMLAFGRHIPVDVPRIALVDFNNDVVRDSLAVLDAYWQQYVQAMDDVARKRWTLYGVRLDTSSNMVDESLKEIGERGVTPELVRIMRRALDNAWTRWDVPYHLEDQARDYCRNVKVVVSGGFNREKIARFEQEKAPVDSYGVGSTFLTNDAQTNTDFTMDVVRVWLNGQWVDMPKIGRAPCDNPDLEPVDLSIF